MTGYHPMDALHAAIDELHSHSVVEAERHADIFRAHTDQRAAETAAAADSAPLAAGPGDSQGASS